MPLRRRPVTPRFMLLLAACVPAVAGQLPAASGPNIVLLVANDLGYADLGFQPDARDDVRTPHLDRLAALGTFFTDAYAVAPVGPPNHAALITRRDPRRPGSPSVVDTTLPEVLRAHGYATALIGKADFGREALEHPLDHGYDHFFGFLAPAWDYRRLAETDAAAYESRAEGAARLARVGPLVRGRDERVSLDGEYLTDVLAREAVAFIRSHAIDADRTPSPFHLHVSFQAVGHPNYVGKPEYLEWFGVPQPAWERDAPHWPFPFWDPSSDPDWSRWEQRRERLGEIDPLGRRRYLACLHGLDLAIGTILDALEDAGILEDTIVVFLSDNGGAIEGYADNAPLRGGKGRFGEGGLRIPMVIAWPGPLVGGRRLAGMVSAMDVMPTVLELAGVAAPDTLDGRSLVPLLRSETPRSPHDHLCWSDGQGTHVVRRGDWKWIDSPGWEHPAFALDRRGRALHAEPARHPPGPHLYDLRTDPGESRDRIGEHPELAAELEAVFTAWRERMADPSKSGE